MAGNAVAQPDKIGLIPGTRRALAGFFVSGLLLSLTGAILLAWGHHISSNYLTIGLYFLSVTAGILVSLRIAEALLPPKGVGFVLMLGCTVACGAILFLAGVGPPAAAAWRMAGLAGIGVAAGLLQASIFQAITPMYERDRAATVNLAGTLLGGGCLTMALLVSGTFYVYTAPSILILIATIPGLFAIMYSRMSYPEHPLPQQVSVVEGWKQLRSPVAVLLALLLFFQFGNEWSMAGWLPLFLVQRLGISPEQSLQLLALYWVALIAGRILAQAILPHVSHAKLLFSSAVAAVFGSLVLAVTNNRFGAITGVLLIGGAWAPIYPLVVENIGSRFPYYRPGFSNGIFTIAFAGALLAPCSLGLFTALWGIRAVMILPVVGTILVLVVVLAIWLEARIAAAQGKRSVASP